MSLDYGEHPHIHVRRDDRVAKFWLDPITLQKAGGFTRTELSKIASLVEDNKNICCSVGMSSLVIEKQEARAATGSSLTGNYQ